MQADYLTSRRESDSACFSKSLKNNLVITDIFEKVQIHEKSEGPTICNAQEDSEWPLAKSFRINEL